MGKYQGQGKTELYVSWVEKEKYVDYLQDENILGGWERHLLAVNLHYLPSSLSARCHTKMAVLPKSRVFNRRNKPFLIGIKKQRYYNKSVIYLATKTTSLLTDIPGLNSHALKNPTNPRQLKWESLNLPLSPSTKRMLFKSSDNHLQHTKDRGTEVWGAMM